ncbi:MAG: aminoglycoside phosphotransferase family protein [Allorhizobium sp.]
MTDDRLEIPTPLVRDLITDQFPQWGDLPVTPVIPGGWNNRTFRLGETMSVRLPSAQRYVAQVEKEQTFLPFLAPHLPLPIPQAVALGKPGDNYPWPFGIYGWIEGETANHNGIADLPRFASDLAAFLTALQEIDATTGPPAGTHNFHRGGSLGVYDGETRRSLDLLAGMIDHALLAEIWETALASRWENAPVWVHGDVTAGNLLIRDGRLSAVIDFGSMGTGDPACDLAIAWTFFDGESRKAFRDALPLDPATWQRARGWTLWKAVITLAQAPGVNPAEADKAGRVVAAVTEDHLAAASA